MGAVRHGGEKLDGVGDEQVVLVVEAGGEEEVPDGRHELLLHEWLELVLVLLHVQPDVVADLGPQLFQGLRVHRHLSRGGSF